MDLLRGGGAIGLLGPDYPLKRINGDENWNEAKFLNAAYPIRVKIQPAVLSIFYK
jgi:hypothetical protein